MEQPHLLAEADAERLLRLLHLALEAVHGADLEVVLVHALQLPRRSAAAGLGAWRIGGDSVNNEEAHCQAANHHPALA